MMRILLGVALAVGAGAAVSGHHSFSAYYFEEQSVTIDGRVVEFALRAPHAWLYVSAPDAQGREQRYGAEWSNPRRLASDGITSATFTAGDRVVITGSPGRNAADYRIHLKRIERPADGFAWSGGRRPGGRRR